jgi:hypothetical protein
VLPFPSPRCGWRPIPSTAMISIPRNGRSGGSGHSACGEGRSPTKHDEISYSNRGARYPSAKVTLRPHPSPAWPTHPLRLLTAWGGVTRGIDGGGNGLILNRSSRSRSRSAALVELPRALIGSAVTGGLGGQPTGGHKVRRRRKVRDPPPAQFLPPQGAGEFRARQDPRAKNVGRKGPGAAGSVFLGARVGRNGRLRPITPQASSIGVAISAGERPAVAT